MSARVNSASALCPRISLRESAWLSRTRITTAFSICWRFRRMARSSGFLTRTKGNAGTRPKSRSVPGVANDVASNLAGDVRLAVADLDNNGALDLILSPESCSAAKSAAGVAHLARRRSGEVHSAEATGFASARVCL